MSNISSIAVKHEEGQLPGAPLICWPDEETTQGLAIWRLKSDIIIIGYAELVWPGETFLCPCTEGKVAGINQFTSFLSVQTVVALPRRRCDQLLLPVEHSAAQGCNS